MDYTVEAKALETVEALKSKRIVCDPLWLLEGFNDVSLQCQYYGKYKNGEIRGFILEYCDGMNLYEKFKQDGKFSEQMVKETMKYAFGSLSKLRRCPLTRARFIFSVLSELQGINLVHGDIKWVFLPVTGSPPNANHAEI